jgi:hypothetical protein
MYKNMKMLVITAVTALMVTGCQPPNMSKAMGMDSVKEQIENEPINEIFKFAKDGTFKLTLPQSLWKVSGKWTVDNGNFMVLTYDKLNDRPMADVVAEVKKEEETGTQTGVAAALNMDRLQGTISSLEKFRLSDDKTKLILQGPSLTGGFGDTEQYLVRMQPDPKG